MRQNVADLAPLCRKYDVILMEDAGSGAVANMSKYGIAGESVISRSIADGADIVMFSGDKLLGGPQSGIIACSAKHGGWLRKHPLYRALRAGKLVYAALEATLEHHLKGDAETEIPAMKMLAQTQQHIRQRAEGFVASLNADAQFEVVDGNSVTGGGTAPGYERPTALIRIVSEKYSADEIDERLRLGEIPVVGRIEDGGFVIDLRTVPAEDEPQLASAVTAALG